MWIRDLLASREPGTSSPPARRGAASRRPARRRLAVEALDPRIVPASLMVSDATLVEGNAGTHYAVVRVTLAVPSAHAVTVNYHNGQREGDRGQRLPDRLRHAVLRPWRDQQVDPGPRDRRPARRIGSDLRRQD